MPITLPVSATADDKAFQKIADRYEKWGAETGKKVGGEMAKGLNDALEGADPKSAEKFDKALSKVADTVGKVRVEEAKLQDLRSKGASDTRIISQAEALERARRADARATNEAAKAYGNLHDGTTRLSTATGMLSDALSGTRFGQIATQAETLAAGFGKIGLATGAAITGTAALVVGVVAAGKALYDLGSRWDNIADGITARTGKVGVELESMMKDVSDVGATTAASLEAIGNIRSQIDQSMPGLSANSDAVKQMTSNLAYLGETGESVNIRELGKAFTAFGVPIAEQVKTLDELNHVAQSTGIPINQLIQSVQSGAPQFKQFGLNMGQATALLSTFEESGLNSEVAVTGLRSALKNLGDDSRGPSVALAEAVTQIKALHDANQGGGQAIAERVFGAKNFAPFLDAIEAGRLDVEGLTKAIEDTGLSIDQQKEATDDWAESLTKIKNRISTGLKPVADTVFGSINEQLEWLSGNIGLADDKVNDMADSMRLLAAVEIKPGSALDVITSWDGTNLPSNMPSADPLPLPTTKPATPVTGLGPNPYKDMYPQLKPGDPGYAGNDNVPGKNGPGQKVPAAEVPYGPKPAIAAGVPLTDSVYSAQASLWEAQHSVEEKRARALQVQADNTHKAEDLVAAQNDVLKAESDQQSAQMRFQSAQQDAYESQFKKLNKTADDFDTVAAKLDDDFGVSKGLPGIAENIVKFLGSLAFAPVAGAMQGVQAGFGFKPGEAGSGLAGIIGSAMGMAHPKSESSGQKGIAPTRQSPLTSGGATALPGESARDFAHRAMTPYWESQGLTVGDHAADQHGEHQNGALDIMVPSIESGNAVLQQVLSDPNVYGAIFNNQTYGYGNGPTPQDYSAGHTGDPNQDHLNHVHAWYKPGDPNNINPNGAPVGLGPSAGVNGSDATRVFVVNMPGSGLGGPTAGAGGPGKSDVPVGESSLWDRVAQAESNGNWQDNNSGGHSTSSGAPRGGLQITDGTWAAYGGSEFAPTANLATKEQQQAVANRIAFGGHNGTPPQGLGAWEAITNGAVPGVTTATPASAFGAGGAGGPAIAPAPGIISAAPPLPAGTPSMGPAAGSPGQGYPLPWNLGVGPGAGSPGSPGGLGTFAGASSVQGGREMGAGTPASGGLGLGGGLIGLAGSLGSSAAGAAGMATMGMDGGAGGAVASAAMQIGIQEGMRAISYAGQLAGIGVGGLMETFSLNDSALADPGKSWFGRIAMGVAGARPALPNSAGASGGNENKDMAESGKTGANEPPGPMDPTQLQNGGQGGAGSEGQSGANAQNIDNSTTINYTSNNNTAHADVATLADHVSASQSGSG